MKPDAHAVSPKVVDDFLKKTLPFSELGAEERARLAFQTSIDFVPEGTVLMRQGETEVEYLYLIQRGGVRLTLADERGEAQLVDFRGEGGSVGALAIIRGSKANLNVETLEDTFFFRIAREAFSEMVQNRPAISQYYLKTFSDTYVKKALDELRSARPADSDTRLSMFAVRVGSMVRRGLVTIGSERSIQEAAEAMGRTGVGSLVVEQEGKPAGIVTDKDFRDKVVARGLSFDLPVERIMSAPILTVPPQALTFDALMLMMKHQVHHLAVGEGGELRGMITSHDFMVQQGRSPFGLFRDIKNESSLDGLHALSERIPLVIRALFDEGARASSVGRMVTLLNDLLLERLLTLLQEELGPPPTPFCWLTMGSEGRREQTFRTDQDNAIVYQDPAPGEQERVREYFTRLGRSVIEHLVLCGFPRCPGDMMASNPKWCQPYSVWENYFATWIGQPEPEQVMYSAIFFDFRPVFGFLELGSKLREEVIVPRARREDVFLRYMAGDCLKNRPPLTFFKSFMVEKDGAHKNTLDLKARGIMPVTDFGRLLSLRHGIRETNTLERLRLAADEGHISGELHSELVDAYEFLMQVRLAHQVELMDQGREPDNHVNPASLTELEKRTLKEAFEVIGRMQAYVKSEFKLNI